MSETGGRPSLDIAARMIKAAMGYAELHGLQMTVVVVDSGGHATAFSRMDHASVISGKIAIDKAYTAAITGMPTGDLAALIQPGAELFGLTSADNGRLIAFGGGFPLTDPVASVVGGVAASGGSVQEDVNTARAALEIWEKSLQRTNQDCH